MIGAFDIQLTQKLAKEYKRANKKRKGGNAHRVLSPNRGKQEHVIQKVL